MGGKARGPQVKRAFSVYGFKESTGALTISILPEAKRRPYSLVPALFLSCSFAVIGIFSG
jgi:hypothetical protein